MIKSDVLKFGEFKLKSGRVAPYFINTGNFKTGRQLKQLGEFYAACMQANCEINDKTVMFGPAYKGIPLVAVAAAALSDKNIDLPICFNRKEVKDHGEGGKLVGQELSEENEVIAVDDVITAGTAISETLNILRNNGGAKLKSVVISVDRMERRTEPSTKTTIEELKENLGVEIYSIVNIKEVVNYLHNREIDGKIVLGDAEKVKIEEYLNIYGA